MNPPAARESGTSIVIPAHNEEMAVGRLLTALLDDATPGEFEILVICNGCTDGTATTAGQFGADVRVIEMPQPSKREALRRGDSEASHLPRLYIDADVEISGADVRMLIAALSGSRILAAAPERSIPRVGVTTLVRCYYDIWERLPQVRSGLFARGVIAISADGYARIRQLPPVMSDDLAMSEAFSADERAVVPGATVIVHPARAMRDLIRRRIRVNTGNAQLDMTGRRTPEAKTTRADLIEIVRHEPSMAFRLPVFVSVAMVSRIAARRRIRSGDFDTWLRDESSRSSAQP